MNNNQRNIICTIKRLSDISFLPFIVGISAVLIQCMIFRWHFHDLDHLQWMSMHKQQAYFDVKWQFLHGSPLVIWILSTGFVSSIFQMKLMFLLMSLMAISCILMTSVIRLKDKKLVWIACSCPIVHVLLSWCGKSDPMLIISFLILVYVDRIPIKMCAILLMLLAHKELGLLLTISYILTFVSDGRLRVAAVLSVCLGLTIHMLYLRSLDGPIASRTDYMVQNFAAITSEFKHNIFSNVIGGLLPYIVIVNMFKKLIRPVDLILLFVSTIIAVTTYDFHRTLSILTFPTIVATLGRGVANNNHVQMNKIAYVLPLVSISGYGNDYLTFIRLALNL